MPDPAPPNRAPLVFEPGHAPSLRSRTAFMAAETAFQKALADPMTQTIVVPADAWEALIGLAATFAAIPADGQPQSSVDHLADRARAVFHLALTNLLTHTAEEIRSGDLADRYPLVPEPAVSA